MNKINLFLFLFLFLIIGCSSYDDETVLKDKIGQCTEDVKIVNAYGDDIRIRYPLGSEVEADKLAREWCDVNGKVSVKGTVSCQGCCYTSYICKN